MLQKLDVRELQNVLKILDMGFLYGTVSCDFDICSAVILVQDRLDEIQKLPNDTRTLMRCDGQDGDEVDTDDEDRVQRLQTMYGSEIPSDEIPIEVSFVCLLRRNRKMLREIGKKYKRQKG